MAKAFHRFTPISKLNIFKSKSNNPPIILLIKTDTRKRIGILNVLNNVLPKKYKINKPIE